MSQIVHIFRKDTRQLRLEVLATLVVMVFFDIFEPRSWANPSQNMQIEHIVSAAIAILLNISWGILIIRLIQTDRLPGVNQFWTTRPVVWWKLMAAKVLFLMCFLYAPLMLSQMLLLHLAGFAVAPNLHLILLEMLLLSATFLLPLASAATVTNSFGQAVLALLGALVLIVLVAVLTLGRNLQPRFMGGLVSGIFAAILSCVAIYQFRWRATRKTVLLYAAAIVSLIAAQWLLPGSSLAVVGYDRPTQGDPISIAIDTTPHPKGNPYNSEKSTDRNIILQVPLVVSGIAPGTDYILDGQKLHLEGSDGTIWESHWENAAASFGQTVFSRSNRSSPEILIPRKVYDKLDGGTVRVSMEFAVAQYQAMPVFQTILSSKSEMVPGLGTCAYYEEWGMLRCLSVFGPPPRFAIGTYWGYDSGAPIPQTNMPAHAFMGMDSSSQLHISPVTATTDTFGVPGVTTGSLRSGTPVSFAGRKIVRRMQMQTATATVSLKDLAGL